MKKIALVALIFAAVISHAQTQHKTQNVILITLDGFRWQEVFNGADSSIFKQQKHLKDGNVKNKYWRDNLDERRKALLPFFWNTIASQGQLYGNRARGCKADVTNNQLFSYPGYNEILTGKADNERVTSNEKFYNPNQNVLEFLNGLPEFKGKVAAFTSWDVFPFIINDKRSGVYVSTGAFPIESPRLTEMEKSMNKLITSIPNPLGDVRLDAFTFYYGMEYMKKNKPRVLYFAFDETDDFAHAGEYAAYLNSAHATDRFVGELWSYLQSDPVYKDKTTLILTSDHGRGSTSESWKHHGQKVPEATQIWMAVIGPDTKALGEVTQEVQVYQAQIASTLAGFLGKDFNKQKNLGSIIANMIEASKP